MESTVTLESGEEAAESAVSLNPELLNARNRGDLVIITGAGISVPSGAPDYGELIHYLQSLPGVPPLNSNESYDKYLGRVENSGTDIREIIKNRLQYKRDEVTGELIPLQPNEYHFEILKLYQEPKDVKIVELNFDNLFPLAVERLWPSQSCTYRFHNNLQANTGYTGITYLHGNILHSDKSQLVITDRNYSRAYIASFKMGDGAAGQFLNECFDDTSKTKLIIGARFTDPIFEHFFNRWAGMLHNTFILVPERDGNGADKLQEIGITPILYPYHTDGNRHRELLNLLRAWNKQIMTTVKGLL